MLKWFKLPEALAGTGLLVVTVSLWGYDPRLAGVLFGSVLIAVGVSLARQEIQS